MEIRKAYFHLPGLFEFYELYRVFLPLYRTHRDWFYDWCEIGSLYGAPADCLWGGGADTPPGRCWPLRRSTVSRPGSPSAIHCCGKST